jgi:hypothetical protein
MNWLTLFGEIIGVYSEKHSEQINTRRWLSSSGLIALMMEAASTSETSVNFYQLHGATTQKTAIFIFAAVRT